MPPQVTKEQVIDALRDVYDPEIPVNVWDLGLIYAMDIDDENQVSITMTLTAPGCGMGPYIAQNAEWRVAEIDGVSDVQVEMVFEPPWSAEMLSPEGKILLGLDD
jgi:FeS assembly SUF system protein